VLRSSTRSISVTRVPYLSPLVTSRPVDAAVVGAVGVAADDEIDGLVQLLDDLHDGAADAGAFVVVAFGRAALVDQHHEGLDALLPQLGHQRVDGGRLVAEGQPGDAGWRDHRGRGFQREADEGHRDALEALDVVGRDRVLPVFRSMVLAARYW